MFLTRIKTGKGRASNTVQLFSTEDTCSVEIPIFLRDALTEYHQIIRVNRHRHAVIKQNANRM